MTPMIRTPHAMFLVAGRRRHHVWLQVLDGGDAGMRVSIPRRDPAYSDDLRETVLALSQGEVVRATLVRPDEPGSNWRVDRLTMVEARR